MEGHLLKRATVFWVEEPDSDRPPVGGCRRPRGFTITLAATGELRRPLTLDPTRDYHPASKRLASPPRAPKLIEL